MPATIFYKEKVMKKRMKKIIISSLCAIVLTACGASDPMMEKGYEGAPTTESGFYENSSSIIGQKFIESVDDTIYFGYDSFALSPESLRILDAQIDFIKENKGVKIVIEGHTDERGTREYNIALGDKRASVVHNYLKSKGISLNDIKNISYGKERPLMESHSNEAWSKNRRAVTIIM